MRWYHCKKDGHWNIECPALAAKKKGSDVANMVQDDDFNMALTSTEFDNNSYAMLCEDKEDGKLCMTLLVPDWY